MLHSEATKLLDCYIAGEKDFDSIVQTLNQLCGENVTKHIERLRDILSVPSTPIPYSNPQDGESKKRKIRPWSTYEDNRLLLGITQNGIENWTAISKFVGNGRTRSQCSQRWYRGLDPHISKEQWTREEEERLVNLVRTIGDKSWTKIASQMGNRSDVQCRYRFRQLMAHNDNGCEQKPRNKTVFPHLDPYVPQRITPPQYLQVVYQRPQFELVRNEATCHSTPSPQQPVYVISTPPQLSPILIPISTPVYVSTSPAVRTPPQISQPIENSIQAEPIKFLDSHTTTIKTPTFNAGMYSVY